MGQTFLFYMNKQNELYFIKGIEERVVSQRRIYEKGKKEVTLC